MAFAKGQRIQVESKGVVHLGHVHKASAAGIAVLLDTWGVTKPVPERMVKPSSAPVPEGAPGHRKWVKGDRVEFQMNGTLTHGTVVSGDLSMLKAIADGGEYDCTFPAKGVLPSSKVIPTPAPSVMDDWGVKSYKAIKALSEETDAFTAEITYKGKAVVKARNHGHGGCNEYQGDRSMVEKFHADAKAWFDEADVEHLLEAGDKWLSWYVDLRPYAVDAMDHLKKFDQELGSAIHMPRSV